jgi:hypothetical protein
MLYALFY